MTDCLNARYVPQRRSDDHRIARDTVEQDHRSGKVADVSLAIDPAWRAVADNLAGKKSQNSQEALTRSMEGYLTGKKSGKQPPPWEVESGC